MRTTARGSDDRLLLFAYDWWPDGSVEIRRTLARPGLLRGLVLVLQAILLVALLVAGYLMIQWDTQSAGLWSGVVLFTVVAAGGLGMVIVRKRPATILFDRDRAVVEIGQDSICFDELGPIRTYARRDEVTSTRESDEGQYVVRHEVYVERAAMRVVLGEFATKREATDFVARLHATLQSGRAG